MHLTTGHIIRLSGNEYKLCLSPACDLVPGQKGDAGFHKRLGGWMPFTAVSLLPTCVPTAVREATAGNYLFFRVNDDRKIKVFKGVPNLSEPMFAANQGRFDETREVKLTRVRANGSAIGSEPVTGTIVSQLRYEYALNLLHRLGYHLSRVGLDFRNLPKAHKDTGITCRPARTIFRGVAEQERRNLMHPVADFAEASAFHG